MTLLWRGLIPFAVALACGAEVGTTPPPITTPPVAAPAETQGPARVDPYWSCVDDVRNALRSANPRVGTATSEALAEQACLNPTTPTKGPSY